MNPNGNDTQRRAMWLAKLLRAKADIARQLQRLQDNTRALERLEAQGKTSVVIVERDSHD